MLSLIFSSLSPSQVAVMFGVISNDDPVLGSGASLEEGDLGGNLPTRRFVPEVLASSGLDSPYVRRPRRGVISINLR